MRILILGNMNNDGYSVAKELRKMSVDVDLGVNSSDFGMALPEWEEGNLSNIDPYTLHREQIKNAWEAPEWIRYFDLFNKVKPNENRFSKVLARISLIRMMREYDVIETHVPYAIYSQFSGIPYVVYDAGWIRYFPYSNGIRDKLARRGYSKAKAVMITNPDTFEISDNLPYLKQDRIYFIPSVIDPEKYRPLPSKEIREEYVKDDELLLFSPSRQIWKEKGNDKILYAYARFVKDFPNSKLIMVAWSVDEEKSKKLATTLGISEKVVWIKPLPKNILVLYYNAADIILDQFVLGSWGKSTLEAMACEKPVLIFYKKKYILRAFGEEPPLLNSFTDHEIYSNLLKLTDADFRIQLGKKSRQWVMRTHHPRLVALKHLEILNSS